LQLVIITSNQFKPSLQLLFFCFFSHVLESSHVIVFLGSTLAFGLGRSRGCGVLGSLSFYSNSFFLSFLPAVALGFFNTKNKKL